MNKNKGKVLATLAALLVLIAVIVLVLNTDLWIVSVICFVVALILIVSLFLGKSGKKTYTAVLKYNHYDPKSSKEYTWAYCEYEGHEFRLIIARDVYRREKLIPGAKYKVVYTVGKDGDPSKSGDAVSLIRVD